MPPLSGLAWSLLAKGASALGMSAMLMLGSVMEADLEGSTGPDASTGLTRNLRLLPDVVLGPDSGALVDAHLPQRFQGSLTPLPSLGLRRFHNVLEVGLTFGANQGIEFRTEESGSPAWLRGLDSSDVAGIESLTLRLSWEI